LHEGQLKSSLFDARLESYLAEGQPYPSQLKFGRPRSEFGSSRTRPKFGMVIPERNLVESALAEIWLKVN